MVDSRGWYFLLKTAVKISVETICYRLMDYERFEIVVQFLSKANVLRGMRMKFPSYLISEISFAKNFSRILSLGSTNFSIGIFIT